MSSEGSPKPRKKWDPANMAAAVNACRNKEVGYLRASKTFQVPKITLQNYVKSGKHTSELIKLPLGRKPVLNYALEDDLVQYCVKLDKQFFGLRAKDVRRLAYQLAVKNKIKHTFNEKNGMAGKKWLRLFMKRHRQLSLRTPQGISAARVKGFTKENVEQFFSILEPELAKIKYNPLRIYNVDETGVTTVQHKHSKIITLKGKKQVGSLTSAERGSLITMVACTNAAGHYIPPLLIFPRKNMKAELTEGAPPGSIFATHPSGWIQQNLFTAWMDHFIKITAPNKDNPVILILDGHYSHTRNVDVIDMARKNYVIIICLPPHCSHRMQPLDLSFMGPFKTYYAQEVETWLRNHPGRVVNSYQVAGILGKAYLKAATIASAVHGFEKSGIFPFNKTKFNELDFLQEDARLNNIEPQPSSSSNKPSTNSASPPSLQSGNLILSSDIIPVPEVPKTQKTKRQGSATLITGSPYKDALEESISKKENKENISKQKACKNVFTESSTSCLKYNESKSKQDEDDALCSVCDGWFSSDKHGEPWIKCMQCSGWFHEACVGVQGRKNKKFTCENCLVG